MAHGNLGGLAPAGSSAPGRRGGLTAPRRSRLCQGLCMYFLFQVLFLSAPLPHQAAKMVTLKHRSDHVTFTFHDDYGKIQTCDHRLWRFV